MIPKLANLLCRLAAIRRESYYLLCRPLSASEEVAPPLPDGMRLVFVDSETSPYLPDLLQFHQGLGFTTDFCLGEVRAGDIMALAIADESPASPRAVAAASWTTYRNHRMDSVLHDFDPGATGCHFLNAYVAPAFRGRKLQRLLQRPRFRRAFEDGKRFVYTIILATNGPSLHNSLREGFVPVVRIDLTRAMGIIVCNFRRLTHHLPAGRFTASNWIGNATLRVGRRRTVGTVRSSR